MWPVATPVAARSGCVCLLETLVSPAKMAELIEMQFGLWIRVRHRPSYHVLGECLDPPVGMGNFGAGKGLAHSKE